MYIQLMVKHGNNVLVIHSVVVENVFGELIIVLGFFVFVYPFFSHKFAWSIFEHLQHSIMLYNFARDNLIMVNPIRCSEGYVITKPL